MSMKLRLGGRTHLSPWQYWPHPPSSGLHLPTLPEDKAHATSSSNVTREEWGSSSWHLCTGYKSPSELVLSSLFFRPSITS